MHVYKYIWLLSSERRKEQAYSQIIINCHCLKSVRIGSYSCMYFPAFILRISPYSVCMRENTDQNNPEYGHFWRSVLLLKLFKSVSFAFSICMLV